MDVASSNDTKARSRSPRPQLRRSLQFTPQDLPLSPLSTELDLDPNDTASVTIEVISDSASVRDGVGQNDNLRHSRNISDDSRRPDTAEPEQEPLEVCTAALDSDLNALNFCALESRGMPAKQLRSWNPSCSCIGD